MKINPLPSLIAATVGLLTLGSPHALAAPLAPAPEATRHPVVDEYQGVKVTDDYRWLEDTSDPAEKTWVAAENQRTHTYFDGLSDHEAIAGQLKGIFSKITARYSDLASRPGMLFALKFAPPKQQPLLVVMPSADDPAAEKILLHPSELDPKGQMAIDWFVPSPDGNFVAVSLSQGGSEDGTLYFYDVATGERLADHIPRVQFPTGGGSVAWQPDGKSVFYTRYPSPGEKPEGDLHFYQQIYTHKLGAPEKDDTYVLGQDFPRIAEIALQAAPDGAPGIVAAVNNGDGGETAYFLLPSPDGAWRQIADYKDGIKEAVFGPADRAATPPPVLYLRSVNEAPHGKILSLPFSGGLRQASVVVPERDDAIIQEMAVGSRHLYVSELVGGPSRLESFDLDGRSGHEIPLPPVSGVANLVNVDDVFPVGEDHVLFRQTSYVEPSTWYLLKSAPQNGLGKVTKTTLAPPPPVDFSDIEVVREFATSKDGTKVPLNILRKKGTKLDGNNPVLLYGYGGYGINETPRSDATLRLWFDRGGVYVDANLRGGGEYGEEWHLGGNLAHKQNVFDDFAAAAEYLIKTGYTNPQELAVHGGSNGGLLMGAFLTQHPDLARAVVSQVGIYDMLRVEHDPNGSFNVTEFGSVKDPAQFQALFAYSPYHHVVDGTKYPAVLFMTGDNDGRVAPYHSRKMIARLQAANASPYPILLRTVSGAGHGIGTALAERIAEYTDIYAFLFDQLGMPATAVGK
jgi:prolyl oligopeptidase